MLLGKLAVSPAVSGLAQALAKRGIIAKLFERLCERRNVANRNQQPSFSVSNRVGYATDIGTDTGYAVIRCLNENDAESFKL